MEHIVWSVQVPVTGSKMVTKVKKRKPRKIYRICHELTFAIKFCKTILEIRYFASLWRTLLIFFRTSLIRFYLKSQRMSDSFYQIAESSG